MMHYTYFDSPVGLLKISGTKDGIVAISYVDNVSQSEREREIPDCLNDCLEQLEEYFAGKRTAFTVKMIWQGTDFQQKVWKEMIKIPYGHTSTYLAIAQAVGDRNSVRAVGAACKQNPIAIIGPCHRVIGSDGDLTGYFGGLEQKRDLLMLENPMVFGKQISLFK